MSIREIVEPARQGDLDRLAELCGDDEDRLCIALLLAADFGHEEEAWDSIGDLQETDAMRYDDDGSFVFAHAVVNASASATNAGQRIEGTVTKRAWRYRGRSDTSRRL